MHASQHADTDGYSQGCMAAIGRIKHRDEARRTVDAGFTLMERDSA